MFQSISESNFHATSARYPESPGRALTDTELLAVSGGSENDVYNTALTVAVGFVSVAAALGSAPVLAGAFALGSIGASTIAIYSELNDDSKNEN